MVVIPLFEGATGHTYVSLCTIRTGCICLVYDGRCQALSIKWARLFDSAVTAEILSRFGLLVDCSRIVGLYYGLHVFHAAVTYFHRVSIKDLAQHVFWGKVFVEEVQESFSDIGFHCLAVWGVEPYGIPVSIPFTPGARSVNRLEL